MTTQHQPYPPAPAAEAPRPDPAAKGRVPLRTWARDLALGARFAAGGGREGWTRTVLTGLGVGLGVALLLLAAAVPAMMDAREQRQSARDVGMSAYVAHPGERSLLVDPQRTSFHDADIAGYLLQPEGAKAAVPPGIDRIPAKGRMVVSPALRKLLASSPLLRERLPYPIVGTIGPAGLTGPAELYYYAGSDQLVAMDANYQNGNAQRVVAFGQRASSEVMGPTFDLLLVIMLVVLLLPVAVFIGTAVRLGGERRDRRLAAMRLVGADIRMTHRIAAGEALLGALVGLVLGAGLFLLGRQLASRVTIRDISAFPSDMTPNTLLTVLIVLAVPLASVAVTLVSLRGTAIEPLGVVRQSVGRRRRLWWRLLVPAIGLAMLAPLFGKVRDGRSLSEYQVATGAVLLLFGVTAVLPWVVEAVVGRLRGGPLPWQLATRRLQLSSSSSARMVSGVTVAVAGAIALQMLFTGVNGDFVHDTGADTTRAQAEVNSPLSEGSRTADYMARIRATRGVTRVFGYADASATQPDANTLRDPDKTAYLPLAVGDCATLREMARLSSCSPGSVFIVPSIDDMGDYDAMKKYARPGGRIDLNVPSGEKYTGKPRLWTIPASARPAVTRADPTGGHQWGIFATPEALDPDRLASPTARITVGLDAKQPDAIEYLRNEVARMGVDVNVYTLHDTTERASYTQLRRGLFAGATLTMALIGASLLVTMLEQLRERKKLLAVLVAFGTRRSALAWSVLWQTAIPVLLGLLLACAGGLGFGAALLAMVDRPFHADWSAVLTMASIGAAVVFAVTLLSLPPLWRLMRADGLRTE